MVDARRPRGQWAGHRRHGRTSRACVLGLTRSATVTNGRPPVVGRESDAEDPARHNYRTRTDGGYERALAGHLAVAPSTVQIARPRGARSACSTRHLLRDPSRCVSGARSWLA